MQNVYAGKVLKAGDSLPLPVVGLDVCLNCVDHLAMMAEKIGLKSMTIVEKTSGRIYYWQPGMEKILPFK